MIGADADTDDKLIERLADDVLASLAGRAVRPVALAVLAAEVGRLRATERESAAPSISREVEAFVTHASRLGWRLEGGGNAAGAAPKIPPSKSFRSLVEFRSAPGVGYTCNQSGDRSGTYVPFREFEAAIQWMQHEIASRDADAEIQNRMLNKALAENAELRNQISELSESFRVRVEANNAAAQADVSSIKRLAREKRAAEAQRDALLAACREYLAWWGTPSEREQSLNEVRECIHDAVARVTAEMAAAGPGATGEATEGERP